MLDFAVILGEFQRISLDIIRNLSGTVGNVMFFLAIIDLTLSMFYDKSEGVDIFWTIFLKILLYGFFIYLLNNYAYLVGVIEKGFIQLGNVATGDGRGTSLNANPGAILSGTIDQLVIPLVFSVAASTGLDLMGIESIPMTLLILVSGIALTAGATAITIVFVFIKFYLTSAVTIITLAFGVFSKSKDVALKGITGLLSSGIELTLTVIVFNFVMTYYDKYVSSGLKDAAGKPVGLLNVLLIVLFFFLLINRVPSMVGTILSGSISSLGISGGVAAMGMSALKQGASAAYKATNDMFDSYKNATGK